MKLLVPVDGSVHSMEAIKVAMDYAKMKGAEISVISVVPYIGGMEDHEISPSRRDRHMENIQRMADEAIRKARDLMAQEQITPSRFETIVTSISVPDAIVEFAERQKADLIIMGSRGLSASSGFRIGSVASQVAKASPCSVYLVKVAPER